MDLFFKGTFYVTSLYGITFQATLFQWLALQTWQKYSVIIAAIQGQRSNVTLH